MSKPGVLTGALGVLFLFTLVSSVRADAIYTQQLLEKLNDSDGQSLSLPHTDRAETAYLLVEDFGNNNGKHLGFSVAAFHGGLKFGLVQPQQPTTQNPEPAGMLLLGTGLAVLGAYARKIRKRRL